MTKIIISEAYEEFRKEICLGLNEIRETVKKPDNISIVNLNKLEKQALGVSEGIAPKIEILLKDFEDFYLIMLVQKKDDEILIKAAYKILSSSIPNFENKSPIEILWEFVDAFGIELETGDKKSKLFYGEIIQHPFTDKVRFKDSPFRITHKNHALLLIAYIKIVGATNEVFCGLAFCIDFTIYLEYLKDNS